MKTVSDDLFRLIKSMTASEKGFFKKYAVRNTPGTKNKYHSLFEAVDSLKSYDEELLIKKLKDASFAKQLSVYKVYLFNLILESLQQYVTYDDSEKKINDLIAKARTLERKALFKEALKYLQRAKEISYKYYKERHIIEISIIERNIIITHPDKDIAERRKALYAEQKEVLGKIHEYFEYSWLSDQMVIFIEHKGDYIDTRLAKELEKIMAHPGLKNEKGLKDYTSKVYFYHTHLFYNLSKGNLAEVHKILGKEIALMEENVHMINENPKNYVSGLINLLLFSNILRKRNDVMQCISKLNRLRKRLKNRIPLDLEIHIACQSYYAELMIYNKNFDVKRGRAVVAKISEYLNKYDEEIPRQLRITILSNAAIFRFIDEDYESALEFTNKLMNLTSPTFKSDLHYFSKIFALLIHFELGNFDLLEYLINSTRRYLRQRKSIFAGEEAIFSFMKEAVMAGSKKELVPAFETLCFALNAAQKKTDGSILFSLFDFVSWAESRRSGMTYIEYSSKNTK